MNTLSNVKTRRGESNPPCISFTPNAFPEAKCSKTGVSVRYEITPNKSWYVFRASYGREDIAADFLVKTGTYTYIPKKYVFKYVRGKKKKILQSLIPNLIFVYTTEDKAEEYVKNTPAMSCLSYYYNHFKHDNDLKNPPLTISRKEMENFIIATCNKSEHLRFVDEKQCHFKGGEIVKVNYGLFKGVEGRVARVSGQQRVVITLTQVGLVSTAYIPTAFLQVVN